jgi:hypothetical protein
VGKIFIVAIFVMSIVYMGFAMAVYSTHVNWRAEIYRTAEQADKDNPLGYKFQVENLDAENKELKEKLADREDELAAEVADKRRVLAKLETERSELLAARTRMQTELDGLLEQNRVLSGTVDSTMANLSRLTGEVNGLRTEIRDVQSERIVIFDKVVATTDTAHQLRNELVTAKERNDQLLQQVVELKNPPDAGSPRVDGEVTAVRADNLIEVSIGSDDGIREGHTVEIFRGRTYLGRAEIVKTAPDRAVGKILKEYRKGVVQKGDSVATRFKVS